MRVLYQGGLIRKKKYTSIRNSSDVVKESKKKSKNNKTEFMKKCKVPKIVPYKSLASFIQSIDIGEIIDLEILAAKFNVEAFPEVYRPLKSFLLKLADLYLFLDERVPCLHWLNYGQKGALYIAIGADGAPFGRDDATTGNYTSINIAHTQGNHYTYWYLFLQAVKLMQLCSLVLCKFCSIPTLDLLLHHLDLFRLLTCRFNPALNNQKGWGGMQ